MAEYFVTRREKCEGCDGRSYNITDTDKGIAETCPNNVMIVGNLAPHCVNGYIDTPVDLLEVLAKVRWTEIGDIITKDGYEKGAVTLNFNNVHIEEGE